VARLTLKQRAKRALTDIKELKVAHHLRHQYAESILTCKAEEIADYRRKAAMIEDLVEELNRQADKGALRYG